ncbi:Gfo/Idh/MocA family oxidoreductase [Candidatus Bathyarchaeota archaeon]|nr:MAG: Gfo/Idh/MocA family oxidoreductase [Candidatus Bathyarchaeota archaeon]
MEQIRIAVIGAGYWGRKVIREILSVSGGSEAVKLHAIVDNSPTMLGQCRQEFGTQDYRVDYDDLLSDSDLTAVHICTPNPTHYEVASAFLKHGKNVMVEKPLTLKSGEAYELVRLARENSTVLCVGHIHRFNNGVKELKRVLSSGTLGEPYYLRLRWTGLLPPQMQRDVITDLAPHPFDICNYLTDRWPSRIACKARGYRTPGNEEVAFMTAEYDGGLTAQVVAIVASKGTAYLDCSDQQAVLVWPDKTETIKITPSNTIGTEVVHFIDCIINRKDSEFANQSDGLLGARVVRILEAAKESLIQDRTVPVDVPILEKILAR